MPLPHDEKLIALSNDLLQQFQNIFGQHPGFRPAHAKGILLTGNFTPTPSAATLSRAPHFSRASTPVTVRFSDATGLPVIPDNNPNANPRGMATRFYLAERVHTDIIAHSADGFPVRTGQEFLEMLRAVASSDPANIKGSPLEAFLGSHPRALAYVQMPKPAPSSFARETYFGVTAVRFTAPDGVIRFGRYRIIPHEGNEFLTDSDVAQRDANYLFDEITGRIGKDPIKFHVTAQLANDDDIVDDATEHWPDDRTVLELGTITLTSAVAEDAREQKHIIFDPIPRIDGIDPSDDPLLELRAAAYLISGRRRREAPDA